MKYFLALTVLTAFSSQVMADDDQLTLAFLSLEQNKNVFVQATKASPDGKKVCYGPLSPKRSEQKILMVSNKPTNVYQNAEECVAANGRLTEYEQNMGLIITALGANEKAKEKEDEKKKNKEFFGINFGLGLAFTRMDDVMINEISLSKVSEADDAMSIIRVDHQTKNRAVAMLESHYFFEKSLLKNPSMEWGHGPFIAIGIAGEEGIDPLSTYGGGWMWGIKRENGSSFNIGIGIYVDTEARLLRPEFVDGQETEITDANLLTHKRDKKGWMLMFSSNF